MTKDELKNGMVVEIRKGVKYLVSGDILVRDKGFVPLSEFNNDLTATQEQDEFDIVKVYDITHRLDFTDLTLLWERKEEHEPEIGDIYLNDDGDPMLVYNIEDSVYYHVLMIYIPYENSSRRIEDGTYLKSELNHYKFVENKPFGAEALIRLVNIIDSYRPQ